MHVEELKSATLHFISLQARLKEYALNYALQSEQLYNYKNY